jgi:N-acetylneuraminic acid mutarotase
MLYVKVGTEIVYAFTISTSTWSQLPDCPFVYDCPLVIISNLLTLIGGDVSEELTINTSNRLFSLTGEGGARWWTEEFPCMPTKRCESTALCTGTALIVVGGKAKNSSLLKTVEIMNIVTKQWSTAADLPHPVIFAPVLNSLR